MKRLKMFLTGLLLVFASTALYAQTEIAGNVTDETGYPVIGATVVVKGTTDGTITDLDGNFKLSVEEGKTLIISYIGFEDAEVTAAQNLRITLKEEVSELDEIVVTGYSLPLSRRKKSSKVLSISRIRSEDCSMFWIYCPDLSSHCSFRISPA